MKNKSTKAEAEFPRFCIVECVINTFLKFLQQFVKSFSKRSLITCHTSHIEFIWNNRINSQKNQQKSLFSSNSENALFLL